MNEISRYRVPKIETADPEFIRDIQEKKLGEQLEYVWKNSPFYKTKFAGAGFRPGDVKTLKFLRSQIIGGKEKSCIIALEKGRKLSFSL